MLIDIKLRVTSKFLGSKNTHQGIFRFRRTDGNTGEKDALLLIEQDVWRWAMLGAVDSLGLDVDVDTIHLPPGIRLGKVYLFERRYKTRPKPPHYHGKEKTAKHEVIREGMILGFKLAISSNRPDDKETAPPPTIGDLEKIFNYIGEYVGLSPFGNQFGFGRFHVHSVHRVTPNDTPDT